MIPKVVHYCWFGSAELPEAVRRARATWERDMPDFEIVEWNESNVDTDACSYTKWCISNRQWAFLSDYVKADVLRRQGGIFLDSDVVTHKSLEPFLTHRAFSGFERIGFPFTAVWASEGGHPWPDMAAKYLEDLPLGQLDPTGGALEPNTNWMSKMLRDEFGIEPFADTFQEGRHGVAIYPSETFCLGAHVGWSTHMFAGSWLDENDRGKWGLAIGDTREASQMLEAMSPSLLVGLARLASFYDSSQAIQTLGVANRRWVSPDLPARVDVKCATRTYVDALRHVTGLYLRGLAGRASRP